MNRTKGVGLDGARTTNEKVATNIREYRNDECF